VSRPLRVAALLSGAGSNLQVLLAAIQTGALDLDLIHVNSNRAAAPGLDVARSHDIPVSVIDGKSTDAVEQDAAIERLLLDLDPELVLLTGYMRILGDRLVNTFRGRMINQHPSLLPRYRGLHTHRRALESRDREHGASVHYVTPELDGGPVIGQVRVPILPGDDEVRLAERLRPREHDLLLAVMDLFADRRLGLGGDDVLLDGQPLSEPLCLEEKRFHV